MANGQEHYTEAEELIRLAGVIMQDDPAAGSRMLLRAQIHATLAVAAATQVSAVIARQESESHLQEALYPYS